MQLSHYKINEMERRIKKRIWRDSIFAPLLYFQCFYDKLQVCIYTEKKEVIKLVAQLAKIKW
jgi:hypothetical protein